LPLYEYKCDKCGAVFEVMQKFSDAPLRVHDQCGGIVERLISAPALQFKGSGWYVTDYAGKGANGSAKTDSESKSSAGDTSKTESKPAESKPAESKPAESKPAASGKSKSE
jgi:putative FmdB family regulatory protein